MSGLLTMKEVEERLRLSLHAVRNAIERGELASHKIGSQYRISEEAVETMLKNTLTLKGKNNE